MICPPPFYAMANTLRVRRAADSNDIDNDRPRTPSPSEMPRVHIAALALDRAKAVGIEQGLIDGWGDMIDRATMNQPRPLGRRANYPLLLLPLLLLPRRPHRVDRYFRWRA